MAKVSSRGLRRAALAVVIVALLLIPIGDAWLRMTLLSAACAVMIAGWSQPLHRPVSVAVVSVAILLLPPSLLGEQDALPGAILVACGAAFVVVSMAFSKFRKEVVSGDVTGVLVLVIFALYWLFINLAGTAIESRSFVIYSIGLVLATTLLSRDVEVIRDSLRVSALSIAVLGFAWVVWLPVVLAVPAGGQLIDRTGLEWRSYFLFRSWNPLLITSGADALGVPRVSDIAGEAGTMAFYAVFAIAVGLMFLTGARRVLAVLGGALLVLGAQSTGAWILVLAIAVASGVVRLLVARITPLLLLLLALIAGSGTIIVPTLLDLKALSNVNSFLDRGLPQVGTGLSSGADATRINLLLSASIDGPIISLLPVAGIAVFVWLARRRAGAAEFGAFVLVMMLLVQPTAMHLGVWVILTLMAVGARQTSTPNGRWRRNHIPRDSGPKQSQRARSG